MIFATHTIMWYFQNYFRKNTKKEQKNHMIFTCSARIENFGKKVRIILGIILARRRAMIDLEKNSLDILFYHFFLGAGKSKFSHLNTKNLVSSSIYRLGRFIFCWKKCCFKDLLGVHVTLWRWEYILHKRKTAILIFIIFFLP